MPNIDDLQIQIEAESQQANKALDTLISKLGELQKSLGASLKVDGLKNVTSSMKSVQTSSDSMAKSIKASMSDVNKTITDASKTMSKNLQEAFNIPSRNMKGVKSAVAEMTTSLATNGRDDYGKYVENVAQQLLKVASSGIKAENSMQGFYDTLKATSKIYINPVDLPTDWRKDLDWLLNQKITTNKSSGATSLDTYIQEWKDEFPEIFNDFNTNTVYDQFEALKKAVEDFRTEAKKPIEFPGLSDAAYSSVAEETNKIVHQFENMSEASRDTAKAIGEHVQEIADKYAGLGEGFKFTGSTDGLEKKIESVTNALETANLKKQELEMSGDISSKMYENAVRDVTKYSNMLESLKQQQAEIASRTGANSDDGWWDKVVIHGVEEAKKSLADFEEQLREADTILENGGVESDTGLYFPTRDLEISLEQLQNMRPQFENEIEAYEDMIERFQTEIELSKEAQGSLGEIGTHGAEIPANLLDTSGLTESIKETRAAISELSDSAITLRERLANMFPGISSMHVYTEEYQNLQAEIDKAKAKIEKLNKAMTDHTADNPRYANTATYKGWQRQAEELTQKIKGLEAEQENLEASGGAKTFDFSPISAMLDSVIAKTQSWKASIDSLYGKLSNVASVARKVTSAFAQLAFNPFGTVTKGIKSLASKLSALVPGLKSAKKATDGFNVSNVGLVKSLTKTTKMLVLMIKRMALRAVISGVQEGFENLAQYCDECNASISLLMNSLNQLKNSFAAMVSPLLNAFAPALNYVIQLIIKAVNYINQLFAALTGKSTWIKATELSEDYAAGLSDAADAAEDLKTTTLGIDELNINGGDDDTGSGSGASAGTSAADMFTTEDVESNIMELADKIKSVFSDLFSTLKSAWDTTGAFVMESWEAALKSVWSLIKSVGSDFLEVWTQAETVAIFEDLLTIIGTIGTVVQNLAIKFQEAWDAADTGLHIFENIRDAIGLVVENIKEAASYTVQWSANLDFTNLLTSIENFTAAAKPAVDAISGALADFYTDVLLPLASWSIQTGLPELIDVFTKFAEGVDWEGLRANLKDLWNKLEPFAETVGEGVILFIERFLNLVKEVLNSQAFQDILDWLGDWLDTVDAEDVANGIQALATALIALKAASAGLAAITSLAKMFTELGTAVSKLREFFTSTFGAITLLISGVVLAVSNFVEMWNNGISGINLALEALGIAIAAIAVVILAGISGVGVAITAGVAAVILLISTLVLYIKEHWEEIKTTVSNTLQTVKNTVSNAWETIKTWTSETWETIKTWISEAWENIKTAVSEAIENVREKISEVWENIKSRTSEVWESIKATLTDVWGNITSSVTEKFGTIKEKITEIWDKVKNATKDTWENIKTTIKDAINGIIGSINGLISGAVSGLNSVIELLNSISFDIPDWVPEWGGKTFGLNIQTISAPQIPYLEQGGFPTSASLFWAGENGVAELLGTVGGKTAVASGGEITGIRDSVESTGATEAQLLQTVISVLQVIADKDTSVNLDGRELVSTIDRRKSRNGYSFT